KTWRPTAHEEVSLIEISVRKPNARRHPDIKVYRRPSLPSQDAGTVGEIPVTSPVRTLLDLATIEPANRLERAINEADKREVIDPESLRRAIEPYAGEPGIRLLRQVLDKHTFLLSDDELELLFHPLVREAGLPLPETKQMVNDFDTNRGTWWGSCERRRRGSGILRARPGSRGRTFRPRSSDDPHDFDSERHPP
ncbi:MAG TPA: hypothetical protein VMT37_14765, partial [Solirubrobacterales bacterium]|nr:hypothetical protein [Solirubrobacterales bacterium]